MAVHFIHMADIHLGFRQYGLDARFNDFGDVFDDAVSYALNQGVNFVLIAGDLFHKAAIDPPTLYQAQSTLARLKQADIPVIAIEGNHDIPRYRDRFSWLDYLRATKLLITLDVRFQDGQPHLTRWGSEDEGGSYIDIDRVRIFGLQYLGASTPSQLGALAAAIQAIPTDDIDYTILVAHFGMRDSLPDIPGGVAYESVAALGEVVDYLGLGHWHKPFKQDGWIYNPGSLESCAIDQYAWGGGFYHVRIPGEGDARHHAEHIIGTRRPFHRLRIRVDSLQSPDVVYDLVRDECAHYPVATTKQEQAVVEVTFEGILEFERARLDLDYVTTLVMDTLNPLVVRPKNATRSREYEISADHELTRQQLEADVYTELLRRDAAYRQQASHWVNVVQDLKQLALADSSPETIIAMLEEQMPRENDDVH